jgi:hypothetical protein
VRLTFFVSVGLLAGCNLSFTRAEQDNFTFHAGNAGIQPFVAALERRLGASAQARDVDFAGSDVSRLFRLSGRGVTVVVNPIPDDRCNPNAPLHATYKDGEYRIDLVYETQSQAERQSAKHILDDSAKEVGQKLMRFREC